MSRNWVVLTNCTNLLPHTLQLQKQYISSFKTSYVSCRCKCHKSGLNCSALCRCDDCQNDEKDEFAKVADQDTEEAYEY